MVYWEGQKDIKMDNKDEDYYDESIYVAQIVPVDEKSMQQMKEFLVEGGFG
jgi:hypothetical protein